MLSRFFSLLILSVLLTGCCGETITEEVQFRWSATTKTYEVGAPKISENSGRTE
jgi:hypothetical protein